jgi:hypothetical protein
MIEENEIAQVGPRRWLYGYESVQKVGTQV